MDNRDIKLGDRVEVLRADGAVPPTVLGIGTLLREDADVQGHLKVQLDGESFAVWFSEDQVRAAESANDLV